MMDLPYSESSEGLRVVQTEKSKIKIVLDRSTNLWAVESDAGPLPVALRDKMFTAHRYAYEAIKNYLDGHEERKLIYKKAKE